MVTPGELAKELGISPKRLRAWLRAEWPPELPNARWDLTDEQITQARARTWAARHALDAGPAVETVAAPPTRRSESDESYVLDLVDEILGSVGLRQHRFEWLLGEPSARGVRPKLPVDGYWPSHGLVVEYREIQHDRPTPQGEKRKSDIVVARNVQRRRYDRLREEEIPKHLLRLVVIKPRDLDSDPRDHLRRSREADVGAIRGMLALDV